MRLIDADKLKIDMDCNIDFGGLDNRLVVLEQIDNAPTVDAIPINVSVEGATNGDVLKAIFNPCRIIKYTSDVQVYFSERFYQFFGMSWWNAPYKGV